MALKSFVPSRVNSVKVCTHVGVQVIDEVVETKPALSGSANISNKMSLII